MALQKDMVEVYQVGCIYNPFIVVVHTSSCKYGGNKFAFGYDGHYPLNYQIFT